MKTRIIIPARLKSTRFPNKLLKKINGVSLIEHICTRAKKIKCDSLVVATDSIDIKKIVDSLNIECWLSKKIFLNGTHRIAYLVKKFNYGNNDIVINIQADEYNFPIIGVKNLINYLERSTKTNIATLVFKNNSLSDYRNKNNVKVMFNKSNLALYFSRLSIPYNSANKFFSHIGIYAYKVKFLRIYESLSFCPYEGLEQLEQLRFLWNNIRVKCIELNRNKSISINSPIDLKLARELNDK